MNDTLVSEENCGITEIIQVRQNRTPNALERDSNPDNGKAIEIEMKDAV